jgi:triosephosphate isomerase
MSDKKRIVLANWKMKLGFNDSVKLAGDFAKTFKDFKKDDIVVCPDTVSLREVAGTLDGTNIKIGAQNVFWEESGSYTGETSPLVLKEAGCKYVIIGHSERRRHLLENYSMIHQKVKSVLDAGELIPVVCIGESNEDRKTDKRDYVLVDQLQQALGGINIVKGQEIIVAYEPVWAIGSGLTIEEDEVKYAYKIITLALNDIYGAQIVSDNFRIIYGGSVTSDNVANFAKLDSGDGLLVGGASLDAEEFRKIADAMLE